MHKLTPFQTLILRACVADPNGDDLAPGGYSSAGRDASRWWRSVKILAGEGLVRIIRNHVHITAAGRRALEGLPYCMEGWAYEVTYCRPVRVRHRPCRSPL